VDLTGRPGCTAALGSPNKRRGWSSTCEGYWAQDLSEEEWKAIFAEAFGPDAVG